MDFNTKQAQSRIEQIANLMSELVVEYVNETEEVGLGEIDLDDLVVLHAARCRDLHGISDQLADDRARHRRRHRN